MRKYALSTSERPFIPEADFVGTIDSEEVSSMGCLLEDGSFLTPLHSIYDLKSGQLLDLHKINVIFIKDHVAYVYKIKRIIHDGRERLARFGNYVSIYDYARLELDGSPADDLGGGFKLDSTDHFSESEDSLEPKKTIAISGPIITRDQNGHLHASRKYSFSKNHAIENPCYSTSQIGSHTTAPGMSGQAILFKDAALGVRSLYAIHTHYDPYTGDRVGLKISDYLHALRPQRILPIRSRVDMLPVTFFSTVGFAPEANKNRQKHLYAKKIYEEEKKREETLLKYEATYETISINEIATKLFPEKLGKKVFANISETDTNKRRYLNTDTGWHICEDKYGEYSTVINEKGRYVCLRNGNVTSHDGKEPGYHCNNVPPGQKKNISDARFDKLKETVGNRTQRKFDV